MSGPTVRAMLENITIKSQDEAQTGRTVSSRPAVIINASSGADDKSTARAQLEQVFASANLDARISLARSGEEIIRLARRAVADRCQPIIAGGGDGTINAVASVLIETD